MRKRKTTFLALQYFLKDFCIKYCGGVKEKIKYQKRSSFYDDETFTKDRILSNLISVEPRNQNENLALNKIFPSNILNN